jgi:hypothetical protein
MRKAASCFLKHKNYLSIMSNLVQEFTLILCVTPSEKIDGKVIGGETLLSPMHLCMVLAGCL